MTNRTIDLVVRAARERRLTDTETAKQMGVEKQVFSNWKRRGMPVAANRKAADFLGCSIDELVGRQAPVRRVQEARPMYGYNLTEDAAHVGAEWQKLDAPLRSHVQQLIEMLVARQVRETRQTSASARRSSKDRPAARDE